jgi:hypothetical protein
LKYADTGQNDKKETTVYVYICNYAINVVFVNLLLKTPPPIGNYTLDALPLKYGSGVGTLSLQTATDATYSISFHI